MSSRTGKSLLLLLPEAGSTAPVRGEQQKIRRYRLVRMRVNPPVDKRLRNA